MILPISATRQVLADCGRDVLRMILIELARSQIASGLNLLWQRCGLIMRLGRSGATAIVVGMVERAFADPGRAMLTEYFDHECRFVDWPGGVEIAQGQCLAGSVTACARADVADSLAAAEYRVAGHRIGFRTVDDQVHETPVGG